MKRTKLLAIPALAAVLLAGCASQPAETNKAPSVVGVKDFECLVNSTIDFLDGVAALDIEDGDITPLLDIAISPEVEVDENGFATFSEVGSYTVNYSIKDSGGRVATKRAYVDVVDRETYKTFLIPEGFTVEAAGAADIVKCGLETGEFKLSAKGGVIAEDVKLSRSYPVTCGLQYIFRFNVNSNVAGKVKFMADGVDCGEATVNVGANVLSFIHTAKALDKETGRDVKIDICLGSLGDAEWTVGNVELEYPQEAGTWVDRAEGLSLAGKVINRMDTHDGTNGLDCNSWSNDGTDAHFRVETPASDGDIWRGGMFINTEIEMKSGVQYKVSFDLARENDGDLEVILQNHQWDEIKYVQRYTADLFEGDALTGSFSETFTPDDTNRGSLWIYVQAATNKNEITLTNLKVEEELGATGVDIYAVEDYSSSKTGTLTTGGGNFKIVGDGGDVEVMSPSFPVAGSGANYVLTFKAKSSAPISMIVAIPVAGGWDPTILWQQITVTEEETIFSFVCNGNDSDRQHKVAWQINPLESGVTVEITDVRICLKNSQLDS